MTINFGDLSLGQLAQGLRSREWSAVEVSGYFLDRIAETDTRIRAWATLDTDRVLAEAALLDQEIISGPRGPLHGIPIGIKDLFDTAHMRTSMGSTVFADRVPLTDADSVVRLRAAGAIVLGKTVTTEFATLDPPPTRNPWDIRHTPGGSSSGSAAAVAAGMCPAATATQTVGSLGRPAAYCGITGILPTSSRVSLSGVFPVAWSLDHAGVFARTLEDACLVLNGMTATEFAVSVKPRAPRIGVVRDFFSEATEPAQWERHQVFLTALRASGVELVELSLPPTFRFGLPSLWTIMRAELATVHEKIYPEHRSAYGPKVRSLVETGMLLDARDYVRALRVRRVYQREMLQLFDSCDVILSPGATGAAPAADDSTGSPLLQAPWTLADFPTVSLPLEVGHDGLPLGIQITGPPYMEEALFGFSTWIEEFIGFRDRPPGTGLST